MHIHSVRRPSLIADPDEVQIYDMPSNPHDEATKILARDMALERLGKTLDSYFWWDYTFYPDNNAATIKFYKE